MTHAVVWIDHKEARIFHVHPEAADESRILSPQQEATSRRATEWAVLAQSADEAELMTISARCGAALWVAAQRDIICLTYYTLCV